MALGALTLPLSEKQIANHGDTEKHRQGKPMYSPVFCRRLVFGFLCAALRPLWLRG